MAEVSIIALNYDKYLLLFLEMGAKKPKIFGGRDLCKKMILVLLIRKT